MAAMLGLQAKWARGWRGGISRELTAMLGLHQNGAPDFKEEGGIGTGRARAAESRYRVHGEPG